MISVVGYYIVSDIEWFRFEVVYIGNIFYFL